MKYLLLLVLIISFPSLSNTKGENKLKVETIHSKKIVGISVRTNNAAEMEPEKAQIPKLWDNFYSGVLNTKVRGFPIYGLYTNYESDVNGEYTLLAGVEVES